jgi:FkbM family methyltransferase
MKRDLATYDQAEERNKLSHFTVQGYDLHGVVQGGVNDGEEIDSFIRMGVDYIVGFEPLSSAFERLQNNLKHWEQLYGIKPKQLEVYQLGLHDRNGRATLNVTDIDGKGSSLFDTNWEHPEVKKNWQAGQAAIIGTETIQLQKFTTWAKQHPEVDLNNYDTLQLDTQGNEMEILVGMGDLLQNFKYLCLELSTIPVYDKETPGQEVADWLDERGFMLDSPIFAHNDAFFIRKDIKSVTDGLYKGRC